MLSLTAKTAALCAEHSSDAVVLDTVSTLETLTTELSNKIWQKISLLAPGARAVGPPGPSQPAADTMARMGQTTSRRQTVTAADRAVVRRLLVASALMLFLELALIRWPGANIVHLALLLELRAPRVVPRHRPWIPLGRRSLAEPDP